MKRLKLFNNINFNYINNNKFKTNVISVNIITNLDKNNVSKNALLSFLMKRNNNQYKNYSDFTRKLYSMYGAFFDSNIDKFQDKQIISFSIQSIDNSFAMNNENLTKDIAEFLFETVLNPCFNEDKKFNNEYFTIEKQNLIEQIESIINNKRSYVIKKAFENLFSNNVLSISKYGEIQDVLNIDNSSLYNAYCDLLKNSQIEIIFVGVGQPEQVIELSKKYFKDINPIGLKQIDTFIDYKKIDFQDKKEIMNITQDKICLLYTGFKTSNLKESSIMKVANCIFGASPTSKLFLNVREKQSLCYYCDSSYDRTVNVMSVDCGLSHENVKKAIDTINAEITSVASGDFTEKELNETKLFIKNSYNTLKDKISSIESFCLSQILMNEFYSIEDAIENIMDVSFDEVKNSFKNCNLKLIYRLEGGK